MPNSPLAIDPFLEVILWGLGLAAFLYAVGYGGHLLFDDEVHENRRRRREQRKREMAAPMKIQTTPTEPSTLSSPSVASSAPPPSPPMPPTRTYRNYSEAELLDLRRSLQDNVLVALAREKKEYARRVGPGYWSGGGYGEIEEKRRTSGTKSRASMKSWLSGAASAAEADAPGASA